MTLVYPSTVTDATNRLDAAVKAVDLTVQNCSALDTAMRASWGSFYVAVTDFVRSWDPSFPSGYFGLGSRMDQVDSYGQALSDWQKRLQSSCALTSPVFDPKPPQDSSSDWSKIAQYAALGAAAISTAYVVGKVVEFIPKPAPRRERRSQLAR